MEGTISELQTQVCQQLHSLAESCLLCPPLALPTAEPFWAERFAASVIGRVDIRSTWVFQTNAFLPYQWFPVNCVCHVWPSLALCSAESSAAQNLHPQGNSCNRLSRGSNKCTIKEDRRHLFRGFKVRCLQNASLYDCLIVRRQCVHLCVAWAFALCCCCSLSVPAILSLLLKLSFLLGSALMQRVPRQPTRSRSKYRPSLWQGRWIRRPS